MRAATLRPVLKLQHMRAATQRPVLKLQHMPETQLKLQHMPEAAGLEVALEAPVLTGERSPLRKAKGQLSAGSMDRRTSRRGATRKTLATSGLVLGKMSSSPWLQSCCDNVSSSYPTTWRNSNARPRRLICSCCHLWVSFAPQPPRKLCGGWTCCGAATIRGNSKGGGRKASGLRTLSNAMQPCTGSAW